MRKIAGWHEFSSLTPAFPDVVKDRDNLKADNARKLDKICRMAEELVALKAKLAALEAKPEAKPEVKPFPIRALRHRHQCIGLVSRWPL